MKRTRKTVIAANVFGAIGYMFLVAGWAFALAVLLAILFETVGTSQSDTPLKPSRESNVPSSSPSAVVVAATYVMTGFVALLSIAILVTLPYFIGRWGSRIVKAFMKWCKIDMTKKQLLLIKGMLATFPLIVLMILQITLKPEGIVFAAMFGATVASSVVAIVVFLVQTMLARRQNIPVENVW